MRALHKLGSTIFVQKFAIFTYFWTCRQSQLLLVRTDGMQVCAIDCRFFRSYLWFEVGAGRS